MNKFNCGDIVHCIETGDFKLTIYKKYEIFNINIDGSLVVMDDLDRWCVCSPEMFHKVDYIASHTPETTFLSKSITNKENIKRELLIYFKDGRVFSYIVSDSIRARAHMAKIWETGYRSTSDGSLTWYGAHYIDKIVYKGDDASTNFPDLARGT